MNSKNGMMRRTGTHLQNFRMNQLTGFLFYYFLQKSQTGNHFCDFLQYKSPVFR